MDVTRTSTTKDSNKLQVNHSPVSRIDDNHQPPPLHDISDAEDTQLHRNLTELETIKSHLKTKNNEIVLLNMEIKSACTVIGLLQHRISELEQKYGNDRDCEAATIVPTPPHCLLLGDTNFRRVIRSDLDENCSVKTISKANMDLLRSWASEKLQTIPSECILYGGL